MSALSACVSFITVIVPVIAQELPDDNPMSGATYFNLPEPVDHIYPAGRNLIFATSEVGRSGFLLDSSDGHIVSKIPLDGIVRAAATFALPDDVGPVSIGIVLELAPTKVVLRQYFVDVRKGYFAPERPDVDLPDEMVSPGVRFLPIGEYGNYPNGLALVIWDRAPSPGLLEYLLVRDRELRSVPVESYPNELVPIGSSEWMLGLHSESRRASLIEINSGKRDDNILLDGLRTKGERTLYVFAPGVLYGGSDTALVLNPSERLLTVIAIRDGLPPSIDSTIQTNYGVSPTAGSDNRHWIVADRALSLILVGSAGSEDAERIRKIGGGLASLGAITLGLSVIDAIALHGASTTEMERFAFLAQGGQIVAVVAASAFQPRQDISFNTDQTPALESVPAILNPSDIAQIQRVLAALGYPVGVIDGLLGSRTVAAIRSFQFDNGLDASGRIDELTLGRLAAALGSGGQSASQSSASAAYSAFLSRVTGSGGLASRILTLGVANESPDNPCFGLNHLPVEQLWPNSVKFANLLRRLETEIGRSIQVVSGFRTPAYNRCNRGPLSSRHQDFAAFDIRLEDSQTFSESYDTLNSALERLEQEGWTTLRIASEANAQIVHVEPQLGKWHAVISSYSSDARGCELARDDVDEFADLLSGSIFLKGREILVARTQISDHYAVSIDLNNDKLSANAAVVEIRRLSERSSDRRTGGDSFVQENRNWVFDPDCAYVRVIR